MWRNLVLCSQDDSSILLPSLLAHTRSHSEAEKGSITQLIPEDNLVASPTPTPLPLLRDQLQHC
jgi:hypothetical protein